MDEHRDPRACCGCGEPVDYRGKVIMSSAEAYDLGAPAPGPWHPACLGVFITGRRGVEAKRRWKSVAPALDVAHEDA